MTRIALYLLLFLVFLPSIASGDEFVKGSYCYTYGDKESLKEAREITRTLAIREAIESSWVHLVSASKVENLQLTKDLVQLISSGNLRNIQVIEHTEKDRTICDKVQAYVNEKEIVEMIQKVKLEIDKTLPNKSDKNLAFGEWHLTNNNDKFPFYTEKDWKRAPAKLKKLMVSPAPFPSDNAQGWDFIKNLEYTVRKIDPQLEPYSISVLNAGYAILSLSKRAIDNVEYDVIELGCKIEIENNSNRAIYAYGGCYLYDEYSFLLANSNIVHWDQKETGVMISARNKGTVRRSSYWVVDSNSTPYPTTRIKKVDYELFLRHDIFELLD
jgi:hypothetical protein